jgi:hypothetical protein
MDEGFVSPEFSDEKCNKAELDKMISNDPILFKLKFKNDNDQQQDLSSIFLAVSDNNMNDYK